MMTTTETFIPYNQNKAYIMVEFVEMRKKEGEAFHDIMVVEHLGEVYELSWDHYHSYYTGKLGTIEGFIP